ncbi:D-arabinono-1,4-lactone oxidase [Kocuria palustris]|uniref:D-arabinono-1,4-lactone oxidase n=1 Tax=Kocuria palustris TaxID=71999 RepID=UPI0011A3827E|nr:D-arabinono-1,4-lactone oxidase [Kocuria palustris]
MTPPDGLPSQTGPTTWTTWDRSHEAEDVRTVRPQSIQEVADALEAAAAAGLRTRVTGAGHSFSRLAEPQELRLDTCGLVGLDHVDTAARRATFLGGTPLIQAARELDACGLAFSNLPDTLHQSIAGAISTATHGTGAGFQSLSGQVAGLTVVLASGEIVECSPTQRPELFQAARTGLGVVGVIAAVTVQCEDSYRLHSAEFNESLAPLIENLGERMAGADHFELFWAPGSDSAHTRIMSRLHRLPAEWSAPGSRVAQSVRRSDDAVLRRALPAALNRLAGAAPRAIPGLHRLDAMSLSSRRYTDLSYKVFASSRPVKFVQTEWAVPLEDLPDAFREVQAVLERHETDLGLPLTVRCSAPEETWLSPAHARYTGWITVRQFWRRWRPETFRELEAVFLAHGGRPHWGGRHSLQADRLRPMYERWDDFLSVREQADPHGRLLNEAARGLLGL